MEQLLIRRCKHLRVTRRDALARITLDRAHKLNALTPEMVCEMRNLLEDWQQDARVRVVLLDGAGTRGFCAGGDLGLIYDSVHASDGAAQRFWADEYRLNAKIADYAKPIVALMEGIVMGGGVGLSAHARYRIVSETTRLAMPEVGVGLIPDVGGTWLLSRTPGQTGTYLALTGESIGAADAIAIGLADYFVPIARKQTLVDTLVTSARGVDVGAVIARFASSPGRSLLAEQRVLIDRAFVHDTVEGILSELENQESAFARATVQRILGNSPTSVKLTLRALREARSFSSLQACLRLEYRLMRRLLAGHDLREGIRAAVIDKDRNPRWFPTKLTAVSTESIDAHFAPDAENELRF
jgi:enoyl-CoA hydratase